MRRLDRYIGTVVLAAIGLVLAVIVGLDAVAAFIDEAEDISDTYSFAEVSLYILLTLPGRCYEYIPFAALIGCLLGLGQLASSSELVVMRAAGVSTGRLVWTALQPALLVAILGFVLGDQVAPHTDRMAETRRALAQDPSEAFSGRHGIWSREGSTFLHFNALEPAGVVHGIILLQFDEQRRLLTALRASRATYAGGRWLMRDVVQTHFSSWQTTRETLPQLYWETGITPDLLTLVVVEPAQLSLADLYRYSRYLHSQGMESEDYRLALWRKILQPLAVGALVLVAISFIFGPLREGTVGFRIFAGVIIGIAFRTSQDLLGPASMVFGFDPVYAALLPIVACALAGFALLARAR
ncbi:LPS export ABC transporter permease LptG [Mangrovimicrobium sediminis]|uniref:LPS export ABC transporter permease LptG n=1 Tax=Mangrovimicrobium sediminis TaxID=2562682 RepID=A0A4Z0LXX9_9GAMM|nr:LPS export ABC transporter permease LptG [Haliea sp. SAOS-164]TGD71935.1 LPS export ABC transporter permease LptG [Haliea sp. SAOS-164]